MNEVVSALRHEFLTWVASRPRTYEEAMEAWRSSCSRHTVWEDAWIDGLIEVVESEDSMNLSRVTLTASGRALLDR